MMEVPVNHTPTRMVPGPAWQAGADMVKVFPCNALGGPQYIKELRGPYDSIPLVAVGGVNADNLAAYFNAGVSAVGVGSSLFGKEALKEQNLEELSVSLKKFIEHDCRTF